MRFFKYVGRPMRNQAGGQLAWGYARDEGGPILVDDSVFGPIPWASDVNADWVRVTEAEGYELAGIEVKEVS